MEPAQQEWQRQCEIEQALQADLDYWMTCQAPGIEVTQQEDI